MKTILALAQLYKGVLIFETPAGFCVYDEQGERIPFVRREAARSFVDAWGQVDCTLSQVPINKSQRALGRLAG
jgi:hypothetical protein